MTVETPMFTAEPPQEHDLAASNGSVAVPKPHGTILFNSQSARQAALARHAAIRDKKMRDSLAGMPEEVIEAALTDPRTRETLKQIDQCDELMAECKDPLDFMRLAASKERLWKLIIPTAGVLRPTGKKDKRSPRVE